MTSRKPNRRRKTVLQDVYEENQRLLGREVSGSRKTVKHSGMILLMALTIGFFLGSPEENPTSNPVSSIDVLLSPEEQVRASLSEIPQEEPYPENPALSRVYGLDVRTIVIDPGHGGRDPGAVGQAGLTEKTLTLDLAFRLERRLRARGFNVILTRRKDINVSLQRRNEIAQENQADLFVSLHINALPVDTLAMIETLYFSPRGDARIEALAERENFNAGYSMGEWQNSLETVGQAVKVEGSRRLAAHIQHAMVSKMRELNPNLVDWGTRSGPFMVLMNSSVPAVMAEVTALSMPEEEQHLMDIEYRKQLVLGLESGILSYISEQKGNSISNID